MLRKDRAEGGFGCSNSREQTTIGGTSFGGLAATHASLTYPETFGNVFSQSGAFWPSVYVDPVYGQHFRVISIQQTIFIGYLYN
jgi:enterochelin esterase-like enzyme